MNVIDEPDLYRLILRSDKPASEPGFTGCVWKKIRSTAPIMDNMLTEKFKPAYSDPVRRKSTGPGLAT